MVSTMRTVATTALITTTTNSSSSGSRVCTFIEARSNEKKTTTTTKWYRKKWAVCVCVCACLRLFHTKTAADVAAAAKKCSAVTLPRVLATPKGKRCSFNWSFNCSCMHTRTQNKKQSTTHNRNNKQAWSRKKCNNNNKANSPIRLLNAMKRFLFALFLLQHGRTCCCCSCSLAPYAVMQLLHPLAPRKYSYSYYLQHFMLCFCNFLFNFRGAKSATQKWGNKKRRVGLQLHEWIYDSNSSKCGKSYEWKPTTTAVWRAEVAKIGVLHILCNNKANNSGS